jgi:hypothetical protein
MTSKMNFKIPALFLVLMGFLSAEAKLDVVASEPAQFQSVTEQKLLGFAESRDFIGVLTREVKNGVNKDIYVYEFKDRSDLRIGQEVCNQLAERVVGPIKKITLKLVSQDIKASASTGHICSLVFRDPDSQALIKERHLLINILNLHPMGYVFRYDHQATAADMTDELKFIESLRSRTSK